jgi:predicted nucleic acid-binding protein
MSDLVFVDTNLLVYSRDAGVPGKQARADGILRELWGSRRGRVSFQVLHEYYVTVTRKLRPGLPRMEAREDVEALLAWHPVVPSEETLRRAWGVEDRWGLSWWDSLIVASALETGCRRLLSEDLQDGLEIESLRIENPFRSDFKWG